MKNINMTFFFVLFSFSANAINIINSNDAKEIKPLLPTTYYIADEEKTSCVGPYGQHTYDGSEISEIKTPNNELIAKTCTRFFKVLCMEGTGILRDRGQGRQTINWAGDKRFIIMDKCTYGLGVDYLCLLPYHTIAADLSEHKVNDIIFVPRTKGLILPDGSTHNGIFVVRDTGGAFRGIGPQRVDFFIANESDSSNVFKRAGFHHKKPEKAYKLSGESKVSAIKLLKEKFPLLY